MTECKILHPIRYSKIVRSGSKNSGSDLSDKSNSDQSVNTPNDNVYVFFFFFTKVIVKPF